MDFIWDTRRQHRIRFSRKSGVEIIRGALVKNIAISGAFSSDPEVFCRVLADFGCPRVGTLYPSSIYPFSLAVLEEINPTADPTMSADQCRIECVYRVANPSQGDALWTLTDSGQGSYIETSATAFGDLPIWVYYKKGYAPLGGVGPAPADDPGNITYKTSVRGIHKFFPQRTIKVTAQMAGGDWHAIKAALRGAAGYINSTPWGSANRGTWLFLFPTSSTSDYGVSFHIDCNFLENPDGFYPIGLYIDRHGEHPTDCANPGIMALHGPPTVDTIQQGNGVVRASVYRETDFNSLFSFTPDD